MRKTLTDFKSLDVEIDQQSAEVNLVIIVKNNMRSIDKITI